MSETYLLTLRPTEPYFFGNEKTFSFDPKKPEDNRYFIKSERTPLQTTVLGALRYLLMPVKNPAYRYTYAQQQQNRSIIGSDSFRIGSEKQDFGVIESISPIFLLNGQNKYVRTPFDHLTHVTEHYTPMTHHCEIETDAGLRWYYPEYNSKNGITDSYMHTKTGVLVDANEIFSAPMQIGINKGAQDKGLYKKQRTLLAKNWAFGIYVTLNTQSIAADPDAQAAFDSLMAGTVVYLGQNKSAFSASLRQEKNTLAQELSQLLPPGRIYCLGDTLAAKGLYGSCLFAATQLRDYRAYRTIFTEDCSGNYVGTVSKEASLFKLLCAGSVLIPDPSKCTDPYLTNENCQQVGFNITISTLED